MNFEEQAKQAIDTLTEAQTKHLNRQLALEAMVDALLERLNPEALPAIAEAYDAAVDRLAAAVPPDLQRPELWRQWTDAIADQQQWHAQKAAQSRTPGAG